MTDTTFAAKFETFFAGCEKIYADYCDRYSFVIRDSFTFKAGKRYMKVVRGGEVHCFVDRENGDVLKAASWNAPALHSRGNIFDDKNGLGWMREFGPAYLR